MLPGQPGRPTHLEGLDGYRVAQLDRSNIRRAACRARCVPAGPVNKGHRQRLPVQSWQRVGREPTDMVHAATEVFLFKYPTEPSWPSQYPRAQWALPQIDSFSR